MCRNTFNNGVFSLLWSYNFKQEIHLSLLEIKLYHLEREKRSKGSQNYFIIKGRNDVERCFIMCLVRNGVFCTAC